jgi:hypothetical protein
VDPVDHPKKTKKIKINLYLVIAAVAILNLMLTTKLVMNYNDMRAEMVKQDLILQSTLVIEVEILKRISSAQTLPYVRSTEKPPDIKI